jgi:hypothetical protein
VTYQDVVSAYEITGLCTCSVFVTKQASLFYTESNCTTLPPHFGPTPGIEFLPRTVAMTSNSRRILLAISLLVPCNLLLAQTASSNVVSPKVSPQKQSAAPQEVFAPYWTSEPGWDTELQMKNNLSAAPLTVTPVLRLSSGEEIPLDPVTIPSNVSVSAWGMKVF